MKTYLIYDCGSGLVKIGKATNVESRLKQLQVGCGSILEVAHVFDCDIENLLHITLKEHRKHGEWFALKVDDVISHVDSHEQLSSIVKHTNCKKLASFEPSRNKLTVKSKKAVDENNWLKGMLIREKIEIPPFQDMKSVKLACKRYSELTGKAFHVEPSKGTVTRIS